jgi:hypothetical protein
VFVCLGQALSKLTTCSVDASDASFQHRIRYKAADTRCGHDF